MDPTALELKEVEDAYHELCESLEAMKRKPPIMKLLLRKPSVIRLRLDPVRMIRVPPGSEPLWQSYFHFIRKMSKHRFFKLVTEFAWKRGYERDFYEEELEWAEPYREEKSIHLKAADERLATQPNRPRFQRIPFLTIGIQGSDYYPQWHYPAHVLQYLKAL